LSTELHPTKAKALAAAIIPKTCDFMLRTPDLFEL
jgi:hypothetical protein